MCTQMGGEEETETHTHTDRQIDRAAGRQAETDRQRSTTNTTALRWYHLMTRNVMLIGTDSTCCKRDVY